MKAKYFIVEMNFDYQFRVYETVVTTREKLPSGLTHEVVTEFERLDNAFEFIKTLLISNPERKLTVRTYYTK